MRQGAEVGPVLNRPFIRERVHRATIRPRNEKMKAGRFAIGGPQIQQVKTNCHEKNVGVQAAIGLYLL